VLENPSPSESKLNAAMISAAKRDLLAKYLRGEIDHDLSSTIQRRGPDASLRLSFAQERLWFLDHLMPGSPVFNVPTAVRISRPLDLDVLQLCVNEIVRRHEVLRTTFVTLDGEPTPAINSQADVKIGVIDLTRLDETSRESESLRLTKEAALRSFDLSRGPLIRTNLIKLTESESIFLLTMHHIVSDGGSILIFAICQRCMARSQRVSHRHSPIFQFNMGTMRCGREIGCPVSVSIASWLTGKKS